MILEDRVEAVHFPLTILQDCKIMLERLLDLVPQLAHVDIKHVEVSSVLLFCSLNAFSLSGDSMMFER